MKITTGLLTISSIAVLAAPIQLGYGQTASDTIAIVGGTLIDGNGGDPIEDSVVLISGNRILAVGEQGEVDVPSDADTIDAIGKFVLPGLWDSQVSYNSYFGEIMLNYGITSTIDVGNSGEVAIPHRNAVQAGILRGPRPFTGLSRLNRIPDGGTGLETVLTPARAPQSTDEARFLTRSFLEAGADALMFNDGAMPMEYYLAGIEVADELGAPVFTRSYGPVYGPWDAVEHSSQNIPHSAGIWSAVTRDPPEPGDSRDWLDMYSDMDDERAEALIERLVDNGTALTPTFQANFRGYPADWATFESEDRRFFATADPDLLAYYPDARRKAALGFYDGRGPGRITDDDVRARKIAGFKNALRFHKMFVDAGGHLVPGANTNPSRIPGENLH
ncbi:MAG: amidohydrolase family protein, partial [Gammaproteobacteria bacterium]